MNRRAHTHIYCGESAKPTGIFGLAKISCIVRFGRIQLKRAPNNYELLACFFRLRLFPPSTNTTARDKKTRKMRNAMYCIVVVAERARARAFIVI